MSLHVLIAQSDSKSTQLLASLFTERGDVVQLAETLNEGLSLLKRGKPDLVVLDLRLAKDGWGKMAKRAERYFPRTKILFTTDFPDPQLETDLTKKHQASALLRQPFTRTELEQALQLLEEPKPSQKTLSRQANLPKVRLPVRIKITLPYVILALLLAIAAAYVVSQVVLDTVEERFTNQLIETGKLANDWMVQEEDRLLETLRLVAYTREIPEAVVAGNAEELRELVLPIAVNYQEDAVEILDLQGVSILSLRHRRGGNLEDYDASRGDTAYRQWPLVQNVLEPAPDQRRDKYADLVRTPWGDYLYIAGPISDESGNRVGVVLVGRSLWNLVRQIRQDTLAHTTIYDLNGRPLQSTLFLFEETDYSLEPETVSTILERQDSDSYRRPLSVASLDYSEIIGPWEVSISSGPFALLRQGNDLGLIGVSLPETFLARPSRITRLQIFLLTTVAFSLVIALGVYLANRITNPLLRVVRASSEVAEGNLDVQVQAGGNDEVAVLAHSFNNMVVGLREGSLYRDLLGRTVSPEVREELRRSFASGELRLEGQDAIATVLVSDIRNFTRLSETVDSPTIMAWLNEYFEELVPIITGYGGIVSKFEGDTVLAFFGILPRPLPPEEGSYQACQAALAILQAMENLNARRATRNEPSFSTGIGVNTGPVTAGGLGSTDRLHYTIIGDTVNTTVRLQNLTRQFGPDSGAVISQHTLFALRNQRHDFELEDLGVHNVKGKEEQLLVYRLKSYKGAGPEIDHANPVEASLNQRESLHLSE